MSVLVATYNRAALLQECLAQLARQAFRSGDEVIVIDNGSTDTTTAVVEAAAAGFPAALRYVFEPAPGKSRAIAAGIAQANGDVLALTDDDALVADDWVAAIREVLAHGNPALAGGRVAPRWSCTPPRWLRARAPGDYGVLGAPLGLVDYGDRLVPLGQRTALGANMALTRQALDAAGGFPLDLGKLRGTLLSGEDHQLCQRVQACGFAAVYDPRLVVRHFVPPDRLRLAYHLRWFFWSGIANAVLDGHGPGGWRAPARAIAVRHWLGRVARGAGRALRSALVRRPHLAVEALVDVAFALGYLACSLGWTRTGLEPARPSRQQTEVV